MWSDRLTSAELHRTQRAIAELSAVDWAHPLLARLERAGGLTRENMPLMFEVRYAQELHRAGVTARYEFPAGVGDSTVEFRLDTDPAWLVELVSVRTSDAVKRATRQVGLTYEQLLRRTPEDPGMSEEAEMITAEQKIGEKVFADGKPTKFPAADGTLRVILTDIRGYLDEGGDVYDYRQMAYGAAGIPVGNEWLIHYWEREKGRFTTIKGLFERHNPLRASRYIQERIHFLGFVKENEFYDGEIKNVGYYLANWHLFSTEQQVRQAYETYPLALKNAPN